MELSKRTRVCPVLCRNERLDVKCWYEPQVMELQQRENTSYCQKGQLFGHGWRHEGFGFTMGSVQRRLVICKKKSIPNNDSVTKRFVLKYSSQIYDPLGLLSPVTVRAKFLMQEISKQKLDWDIPLPDELQDVWNNLATDLNAATQITFPRQYLSKGIWYCVQW